MKGWRPKVLAGILSFLAVAPILIFATNLTQRRPLTAARNAALARAGVQQVPDSVRARRQALQRQRLRPTFTSAVLGIALQLLWVVVIGIVGRRVFQLRL